MEPERRIGTVLRGKWTLERLLGVGGMAAVYVGVHKIGRRDAIKVLHPEIAREPELRARFDQEAYAVNSFVHPGAVEIRDIDVTDDGCPFLVMELLEGESLRARLHRVGVPEMGEILRIADELLDVLAAAHARGIIHRDIKPDNVFRLPDGRIKVLDFGVAHVRQTATSLRTRTGATLGTVAYMPPEQVRGTPIDARADVFAVGATMFRLIANRHIHETPSEAELFVKMTTEPAPPLASVAPSAPPYICAVVDRALAFDRETRYPTASAMQDDVRAVRNGKPPALALSTPRRAQVSPHHGHVDQNAPTIVQLKGVLTAQPLKPMASVTPKPAPATALGAMTQQLTRWTVTTAGEKKLRWIALAFPLVGAAVLGVVFWIVTRVDRDERREMTVELPAAVPPTPAATGAPIATASPARKLKHLEPPSPPEAERPSEKEVDEAAEATGQAREPDPGSRPELKLNCFLTNNCGEVCDRKCNVECTDPSGCTVGAVHDAKVHCRGESLCEVSCAGNCKIHCDRGPCLVHCTPGFECEVEGCPAEVETCAPFLLACGSACPG